jgi:hypothetical protein
MSAKKVKLAKKFIKKNVEREAVEKWQELAESFRKQFLEMIREAGFFERLWLAIKIVFKRI